MKSRLSKLFPQLTLAATSLLATLSCAPVWAANGSEAASPAAGAWSGGLFAVLALVWMLGLYLQSTRRRMV